MVEKKFEESLGKLEDIVRKLESGDLTLDESIKAFEEGIRLAGQCSRKLDDAERRVEILLKGEKGWKAEAFEGGETNEG